MMDKIIDLIIYHWIILQLSVILVFVIIIAINGKTHTWHVLKYIVFEIMGIFLSEYYFDAVYSYFTVEHTLYNYVLTLSVKKILFYWRWSCI